MSQYEELETAEDYASWAGEFRNTFKKSEIANKADSSLRVPINTINDDDAFNASGIIFWKSLTNRTAAL